MTHPSILSIAAKVSFGFACAAFAIAGQAAPTLLGDSFKVTLSSPNGIIPDPTPLNLVNDPLTVGAGVEVSAGDGSDIGGFMLTGATGGSESIDVGASSIALRVLMGWDTSATTGVTGYGAGARYIFEGLDFTDASDPTATFSITGAILTGSGDVTNFDPNWVKILSPHSLSFALDLMEFALNGGGTTAEDFMIQLSVTKDGGTPPNGVPEPGSLALAGLALLAFWCCRRRAVVAR